MRGPILLTIAMTMCALAQPAHAQASGSARVVQKTPGIVRVAVLDTGSHIPETYDYASVRYFDARPSVDIIEEGQPDYYSQHGTWVTSAILENYRGKVEILSYRVESRCEEKIKCEIKINSLVRAAFHAAEQGADIIQISSYGKLGPLTENALASLADKGIHIVMCAGNEGGVSPLVSLAKRNPNFIHIVGSLSHSDKKSFFSARDSKEDGELLDWRLGEDVETRGANGRAIRVTGTSFAASIMTADLIRGIAPTPNITLAARDPIKAAPVAVAVAAVATAPVLAPVVAIATPMPAMADEPVSAETVVETRVSLAEAGEIGVSTLSEYEKTRLRSRAIRPDAIKIAQPRQEPAPQVVTTRKPAPVAPAPYVPSASTGATKSRAIRPGG